MVYARFEFYAIKAFEKSNRKGTDIYLLIMLTTSEFSQISLILAISDCQS
jgi:hypothetical protein